MENEAEIQDAQEGVELIDEPEDLTKQTAILNRYCFWYHKRNHKIQVN
jgi:hypothetical protein